MGLEAVTPLNLTRFRHKSAPEGRRRKLHGGNRGYEKAWAQKAGIRLDSSERRHHLENFVEYLFALGIWAAIVFWDKKIRKHPKSRPGAPQAPNLIDTYDRGHRE